MSPLTPKLFDRNYDELVELGRSQLPRLAPSWTDWNAHDPGITLLELLAWVTEAQLYSIGRMRRDERVSYAALFGAALRGVRPARGLVWPDPSDPESPAATYLHSTVIQTNAVATVDGRETPVFYPDRKTLFVPGRIVALTARDARRGTRDLTHANARGTEYLPFGTTAGPRDLLELEFETRGGDGPFPPRREDAAGAVWLIGVRSAEVGPVAEAASDSRPSPLAVSLVADGRRQPLAIVGDSTSGLLRTGMLALDLAGVAGSPPRFKLELSAPRGFARAPRLLRIAPNVLSLIQLENFSEPHDAKGLPSISLELERTGLAYEAGETPLSVTSEEGGVTHEWRQCERLADEAPDARVFEFDIDRRRLLFGNSINGYKPPDGVRLELRYVVSDAEAGNFARNRRWKVLGFKGAFGSNPDAFLGGAPRSDLLSLRRDARRSFREDHALVSASDLESAALALPLLQVARAWVLPARSGAPRFGRVTLLVLPATGQGPEHVANTGRWVEAVRRALVARLPLGTRLVVRSPGYAEFSVRAQLEAAPSREPNDVREAVEKELRKRLALVKSTASPKPRDLGVDLTRADVAAWLLKVPAVARVTRLELVQGRRVTPKVTVKADELPWLGPSSVEVSRAPAGARP